jgi:hypothetical protein
MKGGIEEIKESLTAWPPRLKFEIVTPEAKIFSDDVDMVTLTGSDGQMGILPQHMPLMTQLVAGEIIAQKGRTRFSSPSATALCRSPATAWPFSPTWRLRLTTLTRPRLKKPGRFSAPFCYFLTSLKLLWIAKLS